MRLLVVINVCVAFLVAIVSNGVQGKNITDILNNMAKKNQSIGCIFKPTKNGLIEEGVFNRFVLYKGILLLHGMNGKEVAMQFTLYKDDAEKQYKIFTYLNAINNPKAEDYGVPTIYYFDNQKTWNGHTIMAMTLVESKFTEIDLLAHKNTKIDFLIQIREYLRIAKYVHSRGVFLKYAKLSHVTYRKHQGFIYDFRTAIDGTNCTLQDKLSLTKENLRNFFAEMKIWIAPHWDWIGYNKKNEDDCRLIRMEGYDFISGFLQEAESSKKLNGLKNFFVQFVKYAYGKSEIIGVPIYDLLYENILELINAWERENKKPAIPSWLPKGDKEAAIDAKKSIRSLLHIPDPFGPDKVEYRKVNYDFFNQFYFEKLNAASCSGTGK